ncbi:MAG TPA: DUF202 domain-containing protein [Blastococcus sp.]|nr:DUF202 domain-containing protein [Blastococcus sp.]
MTFDPGLQAQRTTLAWTRTGVAAGVLAALLLRGAVRSGGLFATVTAVAAVLGALAVLGTGSRAFRPVRRLAGQHRQCDYRGVRAVTVIVVLLGILTVGSLFLP